MLSVLSMLWTEPTACHLAVSLAVRGVTSCSRPRYGSTLQKQLRSRSEHYSQTACHEATNLAVLVVSYCIQHEHGFPLPAATVKQTQLPATVLLAWPYAK